MQQSKNQSEKASAAPEAAQMVQGEAYRLGVKSSASQNRVAGHEATCGALKTSSVVNDLYCDCKASAPETRVPANWHDCEVAEKQILGLQRERDEARSLAAKLAEAGREALAIIRVGSLAETKLQAALAAWEAAQ